MIRNRISIAVVGHLDHGKSTLIGRLLYDTKSLPEERIEEIRETKKQKKHLDFSSLLDSFMEERKRGLTLDTTQAIIKTKNLEYNFIDCPGHKEFIQNMLTGTSQGECAILAVSAKRDEGIEKQTKLHINLVNLLGMKKLIIAITKMDTVGYKKERFLELKDKIGAYLSTIGWKRMVSFVPISAAYGENIIKKSICMEWYKANSLLKTINAEVKDLKQVIKKVNPLILSVQGKYKDGNNEVLFGKIERGSLKLNKRIFLNMLQCKGVIKKIIGVNREKKVFQAGECVSFTIRGINLDKIERGEIITGSYSLPLAVKKIKADIFFLKKRYINNKKFLIRCALQEIDCELKLLNFKEEIYRVNIFLKNPLVVENIYKTPVLGRFVLIDKDNTLAALGKIDV